jgi:hypothetical protein
MKTYLNVRNTRVATMLLAIFAGLVINGLALNQKVAFERYVLGTASAVVLPEIVVIAKRLDP